MNKHKESEIGRRRREKIVRIATRLMGKKGYKGTSLQEIADMAGIHKSSLFHYFRNKEELLVAVLGKGIDEVTEGLRPILENEDLSPEEKLKLALINHMDELVKYIDNVNVFHSEIRFLPKKHKREYLEKRENYASLLQRIIDQIKDSDSECFKGLDSTIVTFGILGMCNWVSRWYKKGGAFTPVEIADVFYQMITQGRGPSRLS